MCKVIRIRDANQIAGYKINIQRLVVFLYTSILKTERRNIGDRYHSQYK